MIDRLEVSISPKGTSKNRSHAKPLHYWLSHGEIGFQGEGHPIFRGALQSLIRAAGRVGADETFFGGNRKDMSYERRKEFSGRDPSGKTAVGGIKDRATGKVSARVVQGTERH